MIVIYTLHLTPILRRTKTQDSDKNNLCIPSEEGNEISKKLVSQEVQK